MQVSAVQASLDVPMVCVSLPPYGALELRYALMEVMRGTAVSVQSILTVADSCNNTISVGIAQFSILFVYTVSCGSGAFRCRNFQCIRSIRRCDGRRDCTDSSDETGCKLHYLHTNVFPIVYYCLFKQRLLLRGHIQWIY